MKLCKQILLMYSFIVFIGCSKKESTPAPDNESPIVAQKLIGTWTMTAQTSSVAWDWNGNGTTETDMYANYDACLKQKGLIISVDKTGFVKQSCTVSNSMEWLVTDYGKIFRFRINTGSGSFGAYADYDIKEVTSTSLKLTVKIDVPGGPQGVIIAYTYTK